MSQENEKLSETVTTCPKCGAKAKQFPSPTDEKYTRGRYYCGKCGWLEDHTFPISSLIEEEKKHEHQT